MTMKKLPRRSIRLRLGRATGALVLGALALVLFGGTRLGAAMPQQTAGQPADISPEALAQIDALIREKDSRTPAQQKMDSQLIYELKMRTGAPIAPGVAEVETDVPYAPDGHTILDVKAAVTDDLLSRLRALGAEVLASSPGSLRIHLDIDRVEAVAAMPDVAFVQ